jgi:hypothetical protein
MTWKELKRLAANTLATRFKGRTTEYTGRLRYELDQIELQGAEDYWIDLYDSKRTFDTNHNGLVFPLLLGITSINPIERSIPHNIVYQPDYPDIDTDFLPIARDHIKKYASKQYGEDRVCSVGLWQTYKPKLAITDVCRVMKIDPTEAQRLTKELPDEFDDMDFEAACNAYPNFKTFADNNDSVIKMSYRLVKLIRSQGRHAGGLIISSVPVRDYIPLTKSPSGPKGQWTSAWTEGKSTQLSKFGFIKFDILGLTNLLHIWICKQFIKKNRGVIIDWGDMDPEVDRAGWEILPDGTKSAISFKDDLALDMADKRRVETIFQFETDLAKSIIQKGHGVKSFYDMVIYTSLGRPGPLPLVNDYVARRDAKNDDWKTKEDPKIVEILSDTYGIIVFQEQLSKFFIKICGFTVPEAEAARKAVAKKWADQLKKIKDKMIAGATKTIGHDKAVEWWGKIESFARYCFNACLDGDTTIVNPITLERTTIEQLYLNPKPFKLLSFNNGELVADDVVNIHYNGMLPIYQVMFSNGLTQNVTIGHKFMNVYGNMETVKSLLKTGHAIKYISDSMTGGEYVSQAKSANRERSGKDVPGGCIIQRNKKRHKSIFIGRNDKENNKKAWRTEIIYNSSIQQCEPLLLFEDRFARKGILDRDVDSRWVRSQREGICKFAAQFERSIAGGAIWPRYKNTKEDGNLQETACWSAIEDISQQQDVISGPKQIWCDSGKRRTGDNATHAVYFPSSERAYGWRRNDYRKWQGISYGKILRISESSKRIQGRDNQALQGKSEQDNRIFREDERCGVVWPKTVQTDPEISLQGGNEILGKEANRSGCYIKSIRYIGVKRTYSPEMRSIQHNYITSPQDGQPIQANSHAMAYIVITFRCLWLKAHYPTEWWASVMTNCKREKLVKYMGIARSEGVKFGSLDYNQLSQTFSVSGDTITLGLESIKGIGDKAALKAQGDRDCTSFDEFVSQASKNKIIFERLIKLGAFDKLHPNRKALWNWYLYKYGSGNDTKIVKEEVAAKLAWSDENIAKERLRQTKEFLANYPRKKKIPAHIEKWKPKNNPTIQQFEEMFGDFSYEERLKFEKEYLGYYWSSPLGIYNCANQTIDDARSTGILEAVIDSIDTRRGKNGAFKQLNVTDGIEIAKVMVWPDELAINDENIFKEGMGVRMRVSWKEEYLSFNVRSGSIVLPLEKKNAAPI